MRDEKAWALKQALADPGMFYGDGGTIHNTNYLDVEVDGFGNVVSVWFRCMMLPFKVTVVDRYRADDMIRVQEEVKESKITGVEIILPKKGK